MKKVSRSIKLLTILIALLSASCKISLLPDSTNFKFYDLTLFDQDFLEKLCAPNSAGQILILKPEVAKPFDGHRIFSVQEEALFAKLEEVEWISPFEVLFSSRLKDLATINCKNSEQFPLFSDDLSAKTSRTLKIDVSYLKIQSKNNAFSAEAKISATIRNEATGQILASDSATSSKAISDSKSNDNKALMISLQNAIQEATQKALLRALRM